MIKDIVCEKCREEITTWEYIMIKYCKRCKPDDK